MNLIGDLLGISGFDVDHKVGTHILRHLQAVFRNIWYTTNNTEQINFKSFLTWEEIISKPKNYCSSLSTYPWCKLAQHPLLLQSVGWPDLFDKRKNHVHNAFLTRVNQVRRHYLVFLLSFSFSVSSSSFASFSKLANRPGAANQYLGPNGDAGSLASVNGDGKRLQKRALFQGHVIG